MRIKSVRFYQSVKMKNTERPNAVINDPRVKIHYEMFLQDGLIYILYADGEIQMVPVTNVSQIILEDDEADQVRKKLRSSENEWQKRSEKPVEKPKRKRGRPRKFVEDLMTQTQVDNF